MKPEEPFSLEAERAALGGIIHDNRQIDPVLKILSGIDFYRPVHAQIFSAVAEIWAGDTPVDLTTLSERLHQKGKLDEIGGRLYLVSLLEATATGANAPYHAQIVREYSIRRSLGHLGREIAYLSADNTLEPSEILERANQKLFSLDKLQTEATPLAACFPEIIKTAEDGHTADYQTGFFDLDEQTVLQKSDFLVLAGQRSTGKTSFALDLAGHLSKNGHPCLIFSLEMSKNQLAARYLTKKARVPYWNYLKNRLSEWQKRSLARAFTELEATGAYPHVLDGASLTIDELYAHSRPYFRNKTRPGVLFVDYIQLVRGPQTENRTQEVAYVARRLKNLAKQLNILVIGLSQFSRKVDERANHRPEMGDLRQSGEIEEAADHVWFLYRPDLDKKKDKTAELIIAKQRNGPAHLSIPLVFHPDFIGFESAAPQQLRENVEQDLPF